MTFDVGRKLCHEQESGHQLLGQSKGRGIGCVNRRSGAWDGWKLARGLFPPLEGTRTGRESYRVSEMDSQPSQNMMGGWRRPTAKATLNQRNCPPGIAFKMNRQR
jgi:hypothetical protein